MYNKKSIDYNRIIHLFWKCILPMICFILARRIMRNGIYVYTSIQELITKKDFTYEDVKKQVVLLCLLFFRIKFLAFFLYKTDFFLPSLKKILNWSLKIYHYITTTLLGISGLAFIYFILQDIFFIEFQPFLTLRFYLITKLSILFPNLDFYTSFCYFIFCLIFTELFIPDNIDFIYTIRKKSNKENFLTILLFPHKTINLMVKKYAKNSLFKRMPSPLQKILSLLLMKIITAIRNYSEIKEKIHDEDFDINKENTFEKDQSITDNDESSPSPC